MGSYIVGDERESDSDLEIQNYNNTNVTNHSQMYNKHTTTHRYRCDGLISQALCFAVRRLSYYLSGCRYCPRYSSVQAIRSMEYLPEAAADGSYINESERNVNVLHRKAVHLRRPKVHQQTYSWTYCW
jgi:hypothetical protein